MKVVIKQFMESKQEEQRTAATDTVACTPNTAISRSSKFRMTVTVSSKHKDSSPTKRHGWLEGAVIQMYKSGMGTLDGARFIESMFGSHYSPTIVSITATVFEVFKNRQYVLCRNGIPSFTWTVCTRRSNAAR